MKKKGFTLIELLAVIVVIAIVTLISIPIVRGIIKNARINALKDSAYGLLEAGRIYYSDHSEDIEDYVLFTIEDNEVTSEEKIKYKGTIDHGILAITYDEEMAVCVDDGKYYAVKSLADEEVITSEGTCDEYDPITGKINVNDYSKEIEDLKNEKNRLLEQIEEIRNEYEQALANLRNEKEQALSGFNTDKKKIAEAIRSRGYQVSDDATVDQLKTGIESISSGPMFALNTVTPSNTIARYVKEYASSSATYQTSYIEVKKLNSDEYDRFTIAADTATKTYSNSRIITSNGKFAFTNAYDTSVTRSGNLSTFVFSPTVIGVLYYYQVDSSTSAYTILDNYIYLKTFKWNGSSWEAVATKNLRPIMYRYKVKIEGWDDWYYTLDAIKELPFQNSNSHYALFGVFLQGYTTTSSSTYTYYTRVGYLSVNKETGAISYSLTSESAGNKDTATVVYDYTYDGIKSTTYTSSDHYEVKNSIYTAYVLSAAGAWTSKSTTVTTGETPYTDLSRYGYVSDSKQNYRVAEPTLSLNTSSKTITTKLTYKEVSVWGYDDLSGTSRTTSKTFNLSAALPDDKSINGSMSVATSPSSLTADKYYLDRETGKLYGIYKLNSGYLYITGEIVETFTDNFRRELSLQITGARYSDTLYDGSNPTSTTILNEPGNHYFISKRYELLVK